MSFSSERLSKFRRLVSWLVSQGAGHYQPYVNPRITLVLGLETRIAAQILDYLDRPSLGDRLSVHFYIEDALHLWNLNHASVNYLEGSKVEPIVVRDLRPLLNQAPTKVIVLSYDDQAITRLWCHLKNSYSRTQVRQTKSITVLEAFHPAQIREWL